MRREDVVRNEHGPSALVGRHAIAPQHGRPGWHFEQPSLFGICRICGDSLRRAAELLGIPYEKITQGGLFPIAYTIGTEFQPAKRLPLEKVLHWDKW